jgi:hypothetical protein
VSSVLGLLLAAQAACLDWTPPFKIRSTARVEAFIWRADPARMYIKQLNKGYHKMCDVLERKLLTDF